LSWPCLGAEWLREWKRCAGSNNGRSIFELMSASVEHINYKDLYEVIETLNHKPSELIVNHTVILQYRCADTDSARKELHQREGWCNIENLSLEAWFSK
jgi:hypothetical protein